MSEEEIEEPGEPEIESIEPENGEEKESEEEGS